jgi:hypothetical protein
MMTTPDMLTSELVIIPLGKDEAGLAFLVTNSGERAVKCVISSRLSNSS